MKNAAAKTHKSKMAVTTHVKMWSFTKAQKNQIKLAVCQLLYSMSGGSEHIQLMK